MSACAFIVGFERFDAAGAPPLKGPAIGALRFAQWVLTQGVPPENIFLFLRPVEETQEYKDLLAGLNGVQPQPGVSPADIEKAFGQTLPALNPTTLYVLWSGHGFTFRRNPSPALLHGVNGSSGKTEYWYIDELRGRLLSQEFSRLKTARLVVDACATLADAADIGTLVERAPAIPPRDFTPDLVQLSAVPIGHGAKLEDGITRFCRVVLEQLEPANPWPADPQQLFTNVQTALVAAAAKVPPSLFRIESNLYNHEFSSAKDPDALRRNELLQLLNACAVPVEKLLEHYRQTLGALAPAHIATSLTQAVKHLLSLDADGARFPLLAIEFLSRVPDPSGRIAAWLDTNATPTQLATVAQRLQANSAGRVLTFLLQENRTAANPFPVNLHETLSDSALDSVLEFQPPQSVASAEELTKLICARVLSHRSRAQRDELSLEVQIVANPVLYPIPFHTIPFDEDEPERGLGELNPLMLRSRDRNRGEATFNLDDWRTKTQAIKSVPGAKIPLASESEFTSDARLRLAAHQGVLSLRSVVDSQGAVAIKIIAAALKRGLPLIAFRSAAPSGDDWGQFEASLCAALAECARPDHAPAILANKRRKEQWAQSTVVLWDDADKIFESPMEEPHQL